MTRLTTKFIENVKPGNTRREIPDAGCQGLYLIVQAGTGRRSWAVRYRYRGKTRKLTLDGFVTLAVARQRCTAALQQLEEGIDPAAAKFEAETLAAQADAEKRKNAVEQLAARFLEQQRKRLRPNTLGQVSHVLSTYVLPKWAGRNVSDVRRRDIIDLVEDIADERPVMANRTLACLSRFFNWLCERDVIEASPCAGVKRPGREQARDRVLDGNEIASLWKACQQVGGPSAASVQLMLLLGQRRGEIVGMRRSEVEGDLWRIPASRMKGRVEHVVPLPTRALALIEAQPIIGDSGFVFTISGRAPVNDPVALKRALDKHMQPKRPWVFHDIRRSVASGMASLDVPVEAIEKILAHRSGTFRGIVGIYQRHGYVPQMRAALERWSEHVEQLVQGASEGDPARPAALNMPRMTSRGLQCRAPFVKPTPTTRKTIP